MAVDLDVFRELGQGRLPGLIGIEVEEIEAGHVRMRLPLRDELLAPNGYLHAGTVVTLADSSCGYGCIASLPEGATGFTTIELKTNFPDLLKWQPKTLPETQTLRFMIDKTQFHRARPKCLRA